jgi:hypothetical protein
MTDSLDLAAAKADTLASDLHALQATRDQAAATAAEAAAAEAARVAALPGRVQFFRSADASFDVWTKAPTVEQQQWMRDYYHRMRVYGTYFDSRVSWFPDALTYRDCYAIYVGSQFASDHPMWILRESGGNPMFIPWGAKPYTQYAADITNPAYRADWIKQVKAKVALGYRGVFVDDVNYLRRVATSSGDETVTPNGVVGPVGTAAWRQYMALFMAEIRHALPGVEIVHNSVWYVPETPEVTFGYAQADWIEIERGVNDAGLTGGTGKYALRSLLDFVDRRHAAGVGVIFDSTAKSDAERMYGLCCYLLTSNGGDMLGSREGGTPGDWWAGYDTQLGKPLVARDVSGGLHFRSFERGLVYVNEPGAAPYPLPDGTVLGPASGVIVLNQERAA